MIFGIGNDIVEIERIEKACLKEAFLCRVYTPKEREQSKGKNSFLAGNFAVKESVSKCFGTGFQRFRINDIEVLRDDQGKPYVNLYNQAESIARQLGIARIHVTITNTSEFAFATAIAESG
ncbi:holo-ACP synthase [Parasporobacterium paucivorans]|uniref:Holo-[acyl-carrier-protein] synthase n=1 Tax=Parasporobacterium paucivorans DSM 15970 TaxID=1122934 RepID=A0A1M6EPZ3_9FIRM|nr:holo-ACP synthase [Parasporobacterium paucivorans]SHI87532.1 holo-[acyl-carrier-protein] synthase [Parasporobacterium paucivorans DSM 15970]